MRFFSAWMRVAGMLFIVLGAAGLVAAHSRWFNLGAAYQWDATNNHALKFGMKYRDVQYYDIPPGRICIETVELEGYELKVYYGPNETLVLRGGDKACIDLDYSRLIVEIIIEKPMPPATLYSIERHPPPWYKVLYAILTVIGITMVVVSWRNA